MGKKRLKDNPKLLSFLFVIINLIIVGIIVLVQVLKGEFSAFSELDLKNYAWHYLVIAAGFFILFYLFEALSYCVILKKVTGKFHFIMGIKTTIVGKYWDSLTPFGSGGQFAQVIYAKKEGYPTDVGTTVVVGKYMVWQVTFILLGVICLFVPIGNVAERSGLAKMLAIGGVCINTIGTSIMYLAALSNKFCSWFFFGGIKLLHKLHIIKDVEKNEAKAKDYIYNCQTSIKAFGKHPLLIISEAIIIAAGLVAKTLIAFCIYKMFNPDGNVPVYQIVAMAQICHFASVFMPIPGGGGTEEVSFLGLFGKLFAPGESFWGMLFWRFFTFYAFVIIGLIYTIINSFFRKKAITEKNIIVGEEKQ